MKQKYQVGDMVEPGIIIAAFHPETYLATISHPEDIEKTRKNCIINWGEEWELHPVYWVLLAKPTRSVSYEDWLFKEPKLRYYKPEFYKEIYEELHPPLPRLGIPEHLISAQILGEGGFDTTKVEKVNE